jgi:MYXO-CTERM domain-containing protein
MITTTEVSTVGGEPRRTVFAVWGLAAAVLAVAAVQRRDV